MKNNKEVQQDFKRKALVYVVVGVIVFTMVFSVFAGLVSAIH